MSFTAFAANITPRKSENVDAVDVGGKYKWFYVFAIGENLLEGANKEWILKDLQFFKDDNCAAGNEIVPKFDSGLSSIIVGGTENWFIDQLKTPITITPYLSTTYFIGYGTDGATEFGCMKMFQNPSNSMSEIQIKVAAENQFDFQPLYTISNINPATDVLFRMRSPPLKDSDQLSLAPPVSLAPSQSPSSETLNMLISSSPSSTTINHEEALKFISKRSKSTSKRSKSTRIKMSKSLKGGKSHATKSNKGSKSLKSKSNKGGGLRRAERAGVVTDAMVVH